MSNAEPPTPIRSLSRSPNMDRRSMRSVSSAKDKRKMLKRADASDSSETVLRGEGSDDTASQDSYQIDPQTGKEPKKKPGEWEIVEGLREGQTCADKPDKFDGFMMKRRKWPMKGWHKRYFVLDKGILTYSKSPSDIQKGKIHGSVDVGLSVLSFKRTSRRIDIDAEDLIYHIKVKNEKVFQQWLDKLQVHRLYRQHEISYGTKDVPRLTEVSSPVSDLNPLSSVPSVNCPGSGTLSDRRTYSLKHERAGSMKARSGSTLERGQSRITAWIMDTAGVDQCNRDLTVTQSKLFELTNTLEKLQQLPLLDGPESNDLDFSKKDKSSKKSSNKKTGRKEKRSQDRLSLSGGAVFLTPPTPSQDRLHGSASNPNLTSDLDRVRPVSMSESTTSVESRITTSVESRITDFKLYSDFLTTAREVHDKLRSLTRTIGTERDRLKRALEQENGSTLQGNAAYIQTLRQALSETMKQNAEMRGKLERINKESTLTLGETPQVMDQLSPTVNMSHSLSLESTSISEFFDAAEYLVSSESTSEASDDDDASSDVSDTDNTQAVSMDDEMTLTMQTGRRSKLPVPKSDSGDVSLWSLLCRNIGKDLSKISMPVTLNEPLNVLQKLCEELEYSDLLDKAAELDDKYERMVYMAAFAVSAYASSSYRAGHKPFNPLLGETYECIREDKGWRFISEQVSHHPPISGCYCESKNFIFWQDVRIKTKFWGKSMEIQPVGSVNVLLPKCKDHYKWNKVTTCVHNILGGQRWVDQHGEMVITSKDQHTNKKITCKLTFQKGNYWSEKRHEVYGSITDSEGRIVHHLFGKWNEGLYYGHAPSAKCIWRPGSMPDDYEMYYGFTRFAIELNEIDQEQIHLYPPTDARFRPDQRALEEGRIQEAENEKLRIEQMQRERRKKRDEAGEVYSPRWFVKVEESDNEVYAYTGKYWEMRRDPSFLKLDFPKIF